MTTTDVQVNTGLARNQWIKLGLVAVVASVLAVLVVQMLAISLWPEIALFKPLDSYARSALFTAIPAVGATALFAWLAKRRSRPVPIFLAISAGVLVLSIIPDYVLPVPDKTLLASTVTAFLHVVAAAVIVSTLVFGYRRPTQ